ncbi:metallophosphoesterase family protein [Kamptonema cortianum]|nr:metallophosphoesterase family protein [Oscillatoria laete-virens]MDK3156410.1 metallophosphoesterase family protein [Kamptonema cortianum]MDL5046270.1 metallophosphoesterase family protein [Oscillatoria amoena NRMC-F 0135]MDL5053909.1 metallophosphoesterase family protein [Oscillatoria laete-virens NRMC-F 0139]
MKIGLISDTHDRLDPQVHEIFKGVDQILHAGDICTDEIIFELGMIAPVTYVLGNNDYVIQGRQFVAPEIEGIQFFMIHIVDSYAARHEIARLRPQVVIHGHTHVPRDEVVDGVRFINPGSVYRGRQGAGRSVAVMEVRKGVQNVVFHAI